MSNESSQINSIHTPCKNCVFAIYDNITQNNCALNFLDIYKKNDVEILEAYDNEKEFYIINNKKCIGYREPKFFDKQNMKTSSLEEKIQYFHEHNHLDYSVIIDLKKLTKEHLDHMFQQLSASTVQPHKMIITRYINQNNSNDFPYTYIESIIKQHNINYSWRMQTILDETLSMEDTLRTTINNSIQQRFVLYVKDFTEQLCELIDKANTVIHKDLSQFAVLSDQSYNAIVFSSAVYKFAKFHNENLLENTNTYTVI